MIQQSSKDCGAYCLAMVLHYHGIPIPVSDISRQLRIGPRGVTAFDLAEQARHRGLDATGVDIRGMSSDDLHCPAIVHWRNSHFIVLEQAKRDVAVIVDPASGRRHMGWKDFWAGYSGVALVFSTSRSMTRGTNTELTRPRPSSRPRRTLAWAGYGLFAATIGGFSYLAPAGARLLFDGQRTVSGPLGPSVVIELVAYAAITAGIVIGIQGAGPRLLRRLTLDLNAQKFVHRLLSLPISFFEHREVPDLIWRVRQLAQGKESWTTQWKIFALSSAALALGLAAHVPLFAVALVGVSIVRLAVESLWHRASRSVPRPPDELRGNTAERFLGRLVGDIWTVKAFGREEWAADAWRALYSDVLKTGKRIRRRLALIRGIHRAVPVLEVVGLTTAGSQLLATGLSVPYVVLLIVFGTIYVMWTRAGVMTAFQGADRLAASISDVVDADVLPVSRGTVPATFAGALDCRDVTYQYAQQSSAGLKQITFQAKPGETVALIGPGGSGKSTLIDVLLGLRQPTSGVILYDGLPLDCLDEHTFRKHIGIASHRSGAVFGTVGEWVRFGNPLIAQTDIEWACHLVGIHEEIKALQNGYATYVEDDTVLTRRQQNLLVLARAVAGRPRILFVDDALRGSSWQEEAAIYRRLEAHHCTRIIASRNATSITQAARILRFDPVDRR